MLHLALLQPDAPYCPGNDFARLRLKQLNLTRSNAMRPEVATSAPLEFIFGRVHIRSSYVRPSCLLQGLSRKAAPSFARVAVRFMR